MFTENIINQTCFFDKLVNIANGDFNNSANECRNYFQDLVEYLDSHNIAQCCDCGYFFNYNVEGKYYDGLYYCDDCLPTSNHIVEYHCYEIRNNTVTNRTFGMELEVEFHTEEDRIKCAERVVNADLHNFFIMAYDGSLNYGIEFISHVWDLKDIDDFKNNLEELTDIIKECGGFCHDSVNSGLHIHIGKTCIHYLESMRNWVYDRPSLFASLSGRIPTLGTFEYCRPFNNSRYSFLNETEETLEFRLWNSTLNVETIIERILFSFLLVFIFNEKHGNVSEREFFLFLKHYSDVYLSDASLKVDFYAFAKKWIGKRFSDIVDYI